MLAYNRKKLDTWLNRKMTEDAANLGLISETEKHNILAQYPAPFFSPRTIMRIGLGFATMVAVGMFFSFIQMVLGINIGDYITHLLFGSAVIVLLEHMIRKKDHYRSGIDDMLLYEGFGIIMAGIISVFDKMPDPSVILSGAATLLGLVATLRYADRLMAALTLLAFILFAYFVVIKIDHHLWPALPLVGMMVSLAAWFGAFKFIHHPRVLYYRHCVEFLQLVSLVVLGVSTNYFVADTWFLDHQQDLSGFWKGFYITTTIALPLVTIGTGLPGRDKKRIRIGALMVVAAVMTFHHYLTTTPVETLCILYGSLLLIVSYWLLRFHKARENGISFSEKQDSRELFDIESLVISAGVSMITPEAASQRYGGGDFGGAGSGGKF